MSKFVQSVTWAQIIICRFSPRLAEICSRQKNFRIPDGKAQKIIFELVDRETSLDGYMLYLPIARTVVFEDMLALILGEVCSCPVLP